MTNEIESQPNTESRGSKPPKRRIKLTALFIGLATAWTLAADGYWHHRQRQETICQTRMLGAFVQELAHRRAGLSLVSLGTDAMIACAHHVGGGFLIADTRGLAYWEILLMAPVAFRFNWDHS